MEAKDTTHTVYVSSRILTGLIISIVNAHKFHEKVGAGVVEKVILIIPETVTLPSTGEVIKVETEEADDTCRPLRASEPNKPDATVRPSRSKQPKPD